MLRGCLKPSMRSQSWLKRTLSSQLRRTPYKTSNHRPLTVTARSSHGISWTFLEFLLEPEWFELRTGRGSDMPHKRTFSICSGRVQRPQIEQIPKLGDGLSLAMELAGKNLADVEKVLRLWKSPGRRRRAGMSPDRARRRRMAGCGSGVAWAECRRRRIMSL